MGSGGDEGDEGDGGDGGDKGDKEKITNAQCPMPNAQFKSPTSVTNIY
ncbi:MAG: histidine kinase [Nostoc sp.]